MSCTLALDTTGRGGAVALAREGELIAEIAHDPEQGFAEELFGLVDRLLARAGRELSDVGSLAVARGPGSFTGLRIGVMSAKTLAYARGWSLWSVGTLELLAADPAAGPSGTRLSFLEAGGEHVFAAPYEAASLRPLDAIRRLHPEELVGWADRHPTPHSLHPWGRAVAEAVAARLPGSLCPCLSMAGRLAVLASRGTPPVRREDPARLVPEYAARSQAERVHGLDLDDEVHRPVPPRPWE